MADPYETYDAYETRIYTYADYLKMEGPERVQLIDGEVFEMASPSVKHQAVLGTLHNLFFNWLKGKPCKVFMAPLDVRLYPKINLKDKTVVQPDLMVVCKKEKIDKNSINGAPDLVVEILSPSNSSKEMFLKFQHYQKAGVKEYWIIEPETKKVQVQIFDKNVCTTAIYLEDEKINVSVLPGLEIDLKDIWNSV